jgi:WD40 repeat protein
LPLSFNQDGRRLYTASGSFIMEWDISPSQEILTLPGRIGSIPFSPDGKQLALIGVDNSLSIVDSQTGKEIVPSWQAHSDWIEDVAWSPDGDQLVTSSGYFNYFRNDNSARIWDAATGQLIKDLPIDWGYHLVAWSPDGNHLVASNFYSGTAFIWDTSSWNLLSTRRSPDADFALAISPDGGKIATSSRTGFAVWDAITGSEVFTYTTDRTPLALVFSPDGEHLAAGLTSGDILLFTLTEAGAEKEQLGFAGGDSIVWSLAFSSDGTLLAAGDGAGMLRVWEVESRNRRLELQTFTDPVTRLAFSPDGSRLVASIDKGITYFYVLPLEELIEVTRSRIILPMTEEECLTYLHQETCPAWP